MKLVDIEYRVAKGIRDPLPDVLVPMVEIAGDLIPQIRDRVHTQGLAGDGGPWSPYATRKKRNGERGSRFYWTPLGAPQPATGRLIVARQGKFAGRAAYPSVGHYLAAVGYPRNGPKSFVMTGELRDSMEVFVRSPGLASIQYNNKLRKSPFYRAKSGKAFTNAKVADFAFRMERMGPMELSAAEVESVEKSLEGKFTRAILDAQQLEDFAFKAERKAVSLERRAKRLFSGAV